jgi:hypothetical protein
MDCGVEVTNGAASERQTATTAIWHFAGDILPVEYWSDPAARNPVLIFAFSQRLRDFVRFDCLAAIASFLRLCRRNKQADADQSNSAAAGLDKIAAASNLKRTEMEMLKGFTLPKSLLLSRPTVPLRSFPRRAAGYQDKPVVGEGVDFPEVHGEELHARGPHVLTIDGTNRGAAGNRTHSGPVTVLQLMLIFQLPGRLRGNGDPGLRGSATLRAAGTSKNAIDRTRCASRRALR